MAIEHERVSIYRCNTGWAYMLRGMPTTVRVYPTAQAAKKAGLRAWKLINQEEN